MWSFVAVAALAALTVLALATVAAVTYRRGLWRSSRPTPEPSKPLSEPEKKKIVRKAQQERVDRLGLKSAEQLGWDFYHRSPIAWVARRRVDQGEGFFEMTGDGKEALLDRITEWEYERASKS